jgi:uncharacterized protein (UPF0332 family)
MPFDFDKYEDVARNLVATTPINDEGCIRSAISRGYYCIFHRAKKIAGTTVNSYATHEKIINNIRDNPEIGKGREIARLLQDLKQDRVHADYHQNPPNHVVFNSKYLDRFWIRFENLSKLIQNASEE